MTWNDRVKLAKRVVAALASGDPSFDYREAAAQLAEDTVQAERGFLERDYGRFGPAKRERKPE